ncbi:MAG: HAD-IC family P-type ATPase, partial [Chloroflexi bacterium]|nr:HAD-IC family P-type ATPase [Chloroflexota bacterium]
LEAAGRLRVMAFDKTGTLTYGKPEVMDVIQNPASAESDDPLKLAAMVESRSEHPLARAVVRAAEERGIEVASLEESDVGVEALSGRGVRAVLNGDEQQIYVGNRALFNEVSIAIPRELLSQARALEDDGKTVMVVATTIGGQASVAGLVAVADTVRPNAREVIAALKRVGIRRTVMLTGDNERTAAAIAAQAGIDEFRANLPPDEKVAAIEALLAEYEQAAMVGDGINDAPALARATVGIAMGGAGTDQALETADIALMADNLDNIPYAIRLSRRTLGIVRQNLGLSLAIKAVVMALALPGLATLWMAVFADVGASLIVILNGMRLLRHRA